MNAAWPQLGTKKQNTEMAEEVRLIHFGIGPVQEALGQQPLPARRPKPSASLDGVSRDTEFWERQNSDVMTQIFR